MKLHIAIEDVQDAEADVGKRLRAVGERHAAEHDLYHLGHTLARQCDEHLRRLAPFADRYGASGGGRSVAESTGVVETVRRRSGDLLGRSKASGLLLLKDLRALYLSAQAAEIAWVILVQAAKAARDPELLDTASSCHQEAETRGKWLRTRIKEASPQVLVAG
jgi:hypothetical protein